MLGTAAEITDRHSLGGSGKDLQTALHWSKPVAGGLHAAELLDQLSAYWLTYERDFLGSAISSPKAPPPGRPPSAKQPPENEF